MFFLHWDFLKIAPASFSDTLSGQPSMRAIVRQASIEFSMELGTRLYDA